MSITIAGGTQYTDAPWQGNFMCLMVTAQTSQDTTYQCPGSLTSSTEANGNGWRILYRGDKTGDPAQLHYNWTSFYAEKDSTGSFTKDVWNLVGWTRDHNGGSIAMGLALNEEYVNRNDTIGFATSDHLVMGGAHIVGNLDQYLLSGKWSRFAFWNGAILNTAEMIAMSKGFSPRRIRPQNLVFYADGIRAIRDLRSGSTITDRGSSVSDHPRSYGM